MRKILITGSNSYIGTSLENWLMKEPDRYTIDTISLRGNAWKEKNFEKYDIVFHVAGIAHVSSDPKMEEQYYKINRDLTVETARKAKQEGVKQFIFMSSIIIYGNSGGIGEEKVITYETAPNPVDFYGDSKLQAEKEINLLNDENFNVVIIRPPMIYGRGAKGNYPKLSKAAKILPIFPDVDNQRSMLHIDNLCEFIKIMIENEETGIFFPQNRDYVKTRDMVKKIAEIHGKKIIFVSLFNFLLKFLSHKLKFVDKAFGNLVYSKKMSEYKVDYRIRNLEDSLIETELTNGE